jgi:hypothetical protein
MEFLQKLNPVSYQWIDEVNADKNQHYGLIAQEVKSVMDELGIEEADFAGYDGRDPEALAMDYNQLVPIIINAIQEEQAIMIELTNRVISLEEKYGDL